MAGQNHKCNENELGQTLGDGEGQGSLECCSPWDPKESDMTGQLNYFNFLYKFFFAIVSRNPRWPSRFLPPGVHLYKPTLEYGWEL